MRVTSREQLNSRSEFIRRCGWMLVSSTSVLALAACGGGGGGGGGDSPAPVNPPAGNTAPTVQAGADQTIEWPAGAQLSGSATDDSSSLTYSWSATGGPSGVTFGTANAAATSVTFPSAGTYTLRLTASDGSLTGTDDVIVTVSAATYPSSDTNNSDATNHGWTRVSPTDVGMSQAGLDQAATYALTGGGSGMVIRRGRLVHSWGDIDRRYDMKSTTKSMGGIALGIALDNNLLALSDSAVSRVPNFGINPNPAGPQVTHPEWLPEVTLQQLATHSAGFFKPAGYPNLEYRPGSTWYYSDGGLNWLADGLTSVFGEDLSSVLNTRVWTTLGLNGTAGGSELASAPANSDVHWRDNQSRREASPVARRELAAGIYANANAMARVGLLFLRKGVWGEQRIVSESFVTQVSTPAPSIANAANPQQADFPGSTSNYGMLWWTNATGQLGAVPRDAYWAWGLGDSLIVVIPSLDLVIVRAGPVKSVNDTPLTREWADYDWNGNYAVLAPFLEPIVAAVAQ